MYSARLPLRLPARAAATSTRPSACSRAPACPSSCPRTSTSCIFLARARPAAARAAPGPRPRWPTSTRSAASPSSVELTQPADWPWRTDAASALLALGRAEEARALAAEELELARRWGAPRPIGFALRTLGLAEGGAGGEQRCARRSTCSRRRRRGSSTRRRSSSSAPRCAAERAHRGARAAPARAPSSRSRCGAAALVERGRRGARRDRRAAAQGVARRASTR